MDIWMAVAVAALAGCVVLGLMLFRNGSGSAASPAQSDELARAQERAQHLSHDLERERAATQAVQSQLNALQTDYSAARERLAVAEARVDGLQKTLTDEKLNTSATMAALSGELKIERDNRNELQNDFIEASQKLSAAEQMEKELRERITRAESYIHERDDKNSKLENQLEELRTHGSALEQELAAFRERESALTKTIAERDERLKGLQEKLKTEFENIANLVLKDATDQLSKKSQESLTGVLSPLQERIKEFKEAVETSHKEDVKDRSALNTEIRLLSEKNQTLGTQAETLAKALTENPGLRGSWAEQKLERILELSNLERGRDFVVQGGDFNIKNDEGGKQRPDVIVILPEKRHLVIDSKISLNSMVAFEKAETDDAREAAASDILRSCRAHIDNLAKKEYQYGDAINSHELVLMFMPSESTVAVALKKDDTLIEYAWNRRIVIVTPSSLFLAMRTVSSIWRYERQTQNARAIADQAGKLYDKLIGFVEDMNGVSQRIRAAGSAHDEAMKKLATGRGNVLSKAMRLKELGVVPQKRMPIIMIDGEKPFTDDDDDDVSEE